MAIKHEFALFVSDVSKHSKASIFVVHDPEIVLRVNSVLRLQPGETCILFDAIQHARCKVCSVSKKSVEFELLEKTPHAILQPKITCLLPLLKRDDLETALYSAVELGATAVQLVLTEKVQRTWGGAKEFERLQRIMIAAAEQSKNFALPTLHAPIELQEAVRATTTHQTVKLFFAVDGTPALHILQDLVVQKPAEIILLVGPEGDVTAAEKAFVAQQHFVTCALTPTILRAVSAFQLGLGLVRSCLKQP